MKHIRNEHTEEFQRSIKDELYIETFQTDEDRFSPEKIESLVNLLEIQNPTDDQEIEEAQALFEKRFLESNKDKICKERRKRRWKHAAQVAAAVALFTVAADVTTQAVMDESLFHMVSKWTGQVVIRPGEMKNETEVVEFEEEKTRYFSTVEEFAQEFGDEFLVFSWLPDDTELKEILVYDEVGRYRYVWNFIQKQDLESRVELWIYQDIDKNSSAFIGDMSRESYQKSFSNGINATFYKNNDGYFTGFEYGGWWYLVNTSEENIILEQMIERMEVYEEK